MQKQEGQLCRKKQLESVGRLQREPDKEQPPPTSKDCCGFKKFFSIKGVKLIQRGKEWTLHV